MVNINKAEVLKKKLIKDLKRSNSIPVVNEIEAGDTYLTDKEMNAILEDYYKRQLNNSKFSSRVREALAKNLVTNLQLEENLEVGELVKDSKAIHPFIDRNYGVVLADIGTIIRAVYDLIDNRKSQKFIEGVCQLNKFFRDPFIPEKEVKVMKCFCGSDKKYMECCKKTTELLTKEIQKNLKNPKDLFELFSGFGSYKSDEKTEKIVAEFIFCLHNFITYINHSKIISSDKINVLNMIAKESIDYIGKVMSSYEEFNLNVLKKYASLLVNSLNVKISTSKLLRNWENSLDDIQDILIREQSTVEKNYGGIDTKNLNRIKVLKLFKESLNNSTVKDYSLITFGYLSILEKELNDLRKLIFPNSEKTIALKNLFDTYKGIENLELIEEILPLYYSFRFINEEKLEDILRGVRNMIAHGEVLDETFKEFEMISNLCMGAYGIFKAISIAKLRVKDEVVFDKDKVIYYLNERVKSGVISSDF